MFEVESEVAEVEDVEIVGEDEEVVEGDELLLLELLVDVAELVKLVEVGVVDVVKGVEIDVEVVEVVEGMLECDEVVEEDVD